MAIAEHSGHGETGDIELEAQDARQGFMTGHMRWVLAASVALAIIVIFGSWAFLADKAAIDQHVTAGSPAHSQAATTSP